MKKIALTIIQTLLNLLLAAAAVMFVVMPLCGYKPYVVLSGSMEPVIRAGAIAYINTHATVPAEGEIAAYTLSNGEVVTHRVTEVSGNEYTFKGDANDVADLSTVDGSQIVGTYTFSIPGLGYMLAKVQKNKLIMIPVVCAIGAVLLLCETLSSDDAASGEEEGRKGRNDALQKHEEV